MNNKTKAFSIHEQLAMLPEGMTLGSDPEFMLYSEKLRRHVSALDVLQKNGTLFDKYNPIALSGGTMMYADNALVEFSFPPSSSAIEFIDRIGDAILQGSHYLGKMGPYSLHAVAAIEFQSNDLTHPKAKEAGCSPNFDAWGGCMNDKPDLSGNLRTGSFHIHIGHPELNTKPKKERMIQLLDRFLGMPSILVDLDHTSPDRRRLYGKAGEFRPTPYGVEYRVLGPYCLRSRWLVAGCVNQIVHAFEHLNLNEPDPYSIQGVDVETIKRCINHDIHEYASEVFDVPSMPTLRTYEMLCNWS